MPAAFNGVWGHKPTGGLISNAHQHPTTFFPFMTTGPLVRYAEDLWSMVRVLAGPDGVDTSCTNLPLARVALPAPPSIASSVSSAVRIDGPGGGGPAVDATGGAVGAGGAGPLSPRPPRTTLPFGDAPGGLPDAGVGAIAVPDTFGGADEPPTPASESARGRRSTKRVGLLSKASSGNGLSTLGGTSSSVSAAVFAPGPITNMEAALVPTGAPVRPPSMVDDLSRPVIDSWSTVTIWTVADITRVGPPVLSVPIDPSILMAVDTAAEALTRRLGCLGVRTMPLPELARGFDLWAAVLGASGQRSFYSWLSEGHTDHLNLGWELLKWCVGASKSTLPALMLALIEEIPGTVAPARQRHLVEECRELKHRFSDQLARTNGVLLLPVHPTTAPVHDEPWARPMAVAYTQLFNVLEVPSTVVPMGLDAQGVPVAIQVVGARGYDRLTIAVAQALQALGVAGWVPPPGVGRREQMAGRRRGSSEGASLLTSTTAGAVVSEGVSHITNGATNGAGGAGRHGSEPRYTTRAMLGANRCLKCT